MNHRTYQSADDLARRLGVSRATIYRWESGQIDPPFSKWIQYLKMLEWHERTRRAAEAGARIVEVPYGYVACQEAQ